MEIFSYKLRKVIKQTNGQYNSAHTRGKRGKKKKKTLARVFYRFTNISN